MVNVAKRWLSSHRVADIRWKEVKISLRVSDGNKKESKKIIKMRTILICNTFLSCYKRKQSDALSGIEFKVRGGLD